MISASVLSRLRRKAKEKGQEALMQWLSDPKNAELVAAAMRGLHEGRKVWDANAAQLQHKLGFATQEDLQAVQHKVSQLTRKVDALRASLAQREA